MRILIIGAAGFIGTRLSRHAAQRGHDVIALCRSGVVAGFAGTCFKWTFGEPLPVSAVEGTVCAIHLAHDFNGEAGARLTLDETVACAAQLRASGVRWQLFFSSYSAGRHASSLYGRTKFALEQTFAGQSDVIIVRPGLVLGEGGIYGRIRKWAQRLPVVPLPNGGSGRVPVITVARLCDETLALAEATAPAREANLFEKHLRSLRELVLDAAAETGRRPWILPVSAPMVVSGLRVCEYLHVPLPVNADNLTGFLANQGAQHVSTLQG